MTTETEVLQFLHYHPLSRRSEIGKHLTNQMSERGLKRTSRIISNAILIAHGYCPISFRSVDSVDYKKALLMFYEQNNISSFKQIFIDQYLFAVKTYF